MFSIYTHMLHGAGIFVPTFALPPGDVGKYASTMGHAYGTYPISFCPPMGWNPHGRRGPPKAGAVKMATSGISWGVPLGVAATVMPP